MNLSNYDSSFQKRLGVLVAITDSDVAVLHCKLLRTSSHLIRGSTRTLFLEQRVSLCQCAL